MTNSFTMNTETFTESPESTTLKPLNPDIMTQWEGFRIFAREKGCCYPDYFTILLWEEFKNV